MDKAYIDWIEDRKLKIRPAQLKASVAVSEEMILLYWDIGKSMPEKQGEFSWGNKIVEQMAKDLKREIPDTNGFSRTNLFAMRKFYLFYKDDAFVHQPGGQIKDSFELVHEAGGQLTPDSILCKIPRRHHIAILGNCNSTGKAKFYIQQIIQNNWSRNVLEMQLESKLIERQGRAANNSELTLPKPLSDLRPPPATTSAAIPGKGLCGSRKALPACRGIFHRRAGREALVLSGDKAGRLSRPART